MAPPAILIAVGGSSAVAYGLATALGAGSADYLAKTTTDRVGALSSLWFLEFFGAPILVALAIAFDGIRGVPIGPLIGLVSISVLSLVGLFCLYRAFELGRLSIVAPLTSGYPALTVVLSAIVLGERFTVPQIVGLGATLAGIVILAGRRQAKSGQGRSGWSGVASALAAFVAFGLFYFGLKFVIGPVPPVTGAAVTRLVGLAVVAALMLRQGRGLWPGRGLRTRAIAFPAIDSLSLVVFNLGVLLSGSIAILTTVSGLYGAVTLFWAIALLGERPNGIQWAGCSMIFAGVVLLALFY